MGREAGGSRGREHGCLHRMCCGRIEQILGFKCVPANGVGKYQESSRKLPSSRSFVNLKRLLNINKIFKIKRLLKVGNIF